MKKVEIISRRGKTLQKFLGNPALVLARHTDPKIVYIPLGELYGVKILIKYKIKKEGSYLILE